MFDSMSHPDCDVEGCNKLATRKYDKERYFICYDCFERLKLGGVTQSLKEFFETPNPQVNSATETYFETLFPELEDNK